MTEAQPPSTSNPNSRQELRELVRSELKILLEQENWSGAKLILVPVQPADIAEAIEGLPEAMQALAQAAIEARKQVETINPQRLQLEALEKTIRRKGVITHREWVDAHPKRGNRE